MIDDKKLRVKTVTYEGTQASAKDVLNLISPMFNEVHVSLKHNSNILMFGDGRQVNVGSTIVLEPNNHLIILDAFLSEDLLEDVPKKPYTKNDIPVVKQGDATKQEGKDTLHKEVCKRLGGIYHQKNIAYNDSVGKAYAKSGPSSLVNRLQDKVNRIDALTVDETIEIGDENLEDTFLDLANYAIMGLIEMQYNNGKLKGTSLL